MFLISRDCPPHNFWCLYSGSLPFSISVCTFQKSRAKIFLEKKAGIAILCSCSKWDNAKKLTTQLCALISSESRPTRDNPYPLLIILPFSECPTKYQDRLEKSSCSLGEITRSGCYYFSLKKGDLVNDLLQETKTIPITFHFISFIFILGIFRHGLLEINLVTKMLLFCNIFGPRSCN